jgi:hypothetical protein
MELFRFLNATDSHFCLLSINGACTMMVRGGCLMCVHLRAIDFIFSNLVTGGKYLSGEITSPKIYIFARKD